MFVNVCIEVLSEALNDTYTYKVSDELSSFIGLGTRVLVDFGPRRVVGVVIEFVSSYEGSCKEIIDCLDYSKQLNEEQIYLAKFIASELNIKLINAIILFYPSFLKTKYKKYLKVNSKNLNPEIQLLFGGRKKIVLTKEILKEYPKIKKEIENNNLEIVTDIKTYGSKLFKKYYEVNIIKPNLSKVESKIVKYLTEFGKTSTEQIADKLNCSMAMIFKLEKENVIKSSVIEYVEEDNNKVGLQNIFFPIDQKEVKEKYLNSSLPFLFNSNSNTFKKEFILDICIDNIKENSLTLVVTPTIITNYNYYHYLSKKLKGFNVINISNDISESEFYINYTQILKGNIDVVVTTSVGVTLPYSNIKTIFVIDESSNHYIREKSPKVNYISILKERALYHNAKLVLESTPLTVENYYLYHLHKYTILKYNIPKNNNYYLVDMNEEVIYGNDVISSKLNNLIQETLNKESQVVLVLNTLGYSNHLSCPSCGSVCKCSKCGISLVYYKDKDEIKCNYCGLKHQNKLCSKCNTILNLYGIGLEKVNEVIKNLFPTSKTLIVDSESLKDYEDYKNIVVSIESNEVDIIIGTNNVLNLIHNSSVSLVGFISLDSIINASDYRASYNAFYLINSINKENVLIQTYSKDHYAINYAIKNDFLGFYNEEIKVRETLNYPPFIEINKISIIGEYKEMYHCSNYIKKVYSNLTSSKILGPNYNKVIKGVVLLIKVNDVSKLYKLLEEVKKKFDKLKIYYERYPKWLN